MSLVTYNHLKISCLPSSPLGTNSGFFFLVVARHIHHLKHYNRLEVKKMSVCCRDLDDNNFWGTLDLAQILDTRHAGGTSELTLSIANNNFNDVFYNDSVSNLRTLIVK
jgi:hypothetical protein